MKCPECKKRHTGEWKPGNPLAKCEAASQFDLGHLIIRGLKTDDPMMVAARARSDAFKEYLTKRQ
jgi:hypothetical protein